MSSLDDKLKDILSDLEKVSSGLIQVPWNQHDRALQQIKQAFKDAGYVSPENAKKVQDMVNQMANLANDAFHLPTIQYLAVNKQQTKAKNLLSGAEWYERFAEEAEKIDLSFKRFAPSKQISQQLSLEIEKAAKRASGLDMEG